MIVDRPQPCSLRTFLPLTCHPPRRPLVPISGPPASHDTTRHRPRPPSRHRPRLRLIRLFRNQKANPRPTDFVHLCCTGPTRQASSIHRQSHITFDVTAIISSCVDRSSTDQDAPKGMEPPSLGRFIDMFDRARPVTDTRTPTASPSGRSQSGTQSRTRSLRPHTCQEGR
jgi:hypothetical protein